MDRTLLKKAKEYNMKHHRNSIRRKLVRFLGCVVVFCTTYALILPAITREKPTFCGMEEHIHGAHCYVQVEEAEEKVLVCTEPEVQIHAHAKECYTLLPGHVHDENCYTLLEKQLICSLEESEGHVHTEECYEQLSVLSCEMEESEDTNVLVCEIPEKQVHIHEDVCYEVVSVMELSCGLPEDENHAHTELCYGTWNLNCAIEEHTHSLICYSDKNADVESKADWMRTFSDVKLTGNWAEDVMTIAQTQLGYRESTKNYIVLEDGETQKGYTRYGDWYGLPYEDWCAMFASFCIHYAEVEDMPLEAGCQKWIINLTEKGMYQKAGAYEPVPGDLIFFDWDDDGNADHVGLVAENKDIIETIEGNSGNRVAKNQYKKNDKTILGYGLLPVNPDAVVIGENQSGVYDEDNNLLYVVPDHETFGANAAPTVEVPIAPTLEPTVNTTIEPIAEPTVEIAVDPTMEPTVDATIEPTAEAVIAEPTLEPSNSPDADPVVENEDDTMQVVEDVPLEVSPEVSGGIEYSCGSAYHIHDAECFDAEGNLICVDVEHTHDESCLIAEEPVIEYFCGLAEHVHGEECFDAEGNLICVEIEHAHDESCLIAEEPVIEYFCGLAEHVHG